MPMVEISEDAETILRMKAYDFKVPTAVILDAMIREFSPSTAAAIVLQQETKTRHCEEFLQRYPDATAEQAWRRGHATGWQDYQTRKPDTFIRLIQEYQQQRRLRQGSDAPR